MSETNPFSIPKRDVVTAFERVKANKGTYGIDGQTIEEFEKNLKDNLFKIWNRMSSGSYIPKPVKAVPIPKKNGGTRILGIPTVEDRIAQMVVKLHLEPLVEPMFYEDSYGYRPNKSAVQALEITRERCWKRDWVLEFDIKGLFDNIRHDLLMEMVRRHTDEGWIILYIQRWLTTPFQMKDGTQVQRTSGTPQGGVISPVLANLFLHYVFDDFMAKEFKSIPWARSTYSVVHCRTEQEAKQLLADIDARLRDCKLELHPTKTKIVYCKDKDRQKEYPNTEFDFLGYTFRRVWIKDRLGRLRMNFIASVSKKAEQTLKDKVKSLEIHKRTGSKIDMIAEVLNPILRGWMNYFGKYNRSAMKRALDCVQRRLIKWAKCKYKNFRGHRRRAEEWLCQVRKREPNMFAHWVLCGNF